jgi:RND family efflux transporter MFP subunit
MKKRLKFIIPAIIVLFIGLLVYRNSSFSKNPNDTPHTKVKKGDLKQEITISGQIDADEKADVRFQTSGRLAWVGVKEGDYVKQYQSLASLDQRDVKNALQKDLNDYAKERLDFDAAKRENKDTQYDVNPQVRDQIQTLFEKNQLDLDSSVLQVELQNLALEYSNLWTPIAGLVTSVGAPFAGTNITPAQAAFEIINPESVYFSASPDQSEVTQFFEGETGELVLDAYPDEILGGNITQIAFVPKSGESSTVYPMKFTFTGDNSSYRYKIGMTGDLTFTLKRKYDVLYLPVKYVRTDKDKKYVYTLQNGKIAKKYIETGLETDTSIEITKGLEKDQIVYDQTK